MSKSKRQIKRKRSKSKQPSTLDVLKAVWNSEDKTNRISIIMILGLIVVTACIILTSK